MLKQTTTLLLALGATAVLAGPAAAQDPGPADLAGVSDQARAMDVRVERPLDRVGPDRAPDRIKNQRIKQQRIKNARIKNARKKQARIKQARLKQARIKQARQKQARIKQARKKQARIKSARSGS